MKLVAGDILTPNTDPSRRVVVCHQVNCRGVMGAGLALSVRQQFPSVYYAYKRRCEQDDFYIHGSLGDVQFCSARKEAGYDIANIFGQYDYGRSGQYTSYAALRTAFMAIARKCRGCVVRIPYGMGCGLGGGDWTVVSQLIEEILVGAGVEVEIWRLPQDHP